MCGIVGWANLDPESPINKERETNLLREMCSEMHHRGPDAEGVVVSGQTGLGMRRLAVIDVNQRATQPVFNRDRSISAVINGEIYNFKKLRQELRRKGYRFSSETDSEVLPNLYEEYNLRLFKKLEGMFAFALWNSRRKMLLLARDRFGEKPLYYGVFNRRLFFASELKALIKHPEVTTRLNIHALQHYLTFDYIPAPHSIYENIYKLPAAHFLELAEGKLKIAKYWDLSFHKRESPPSIEEAAEELRSLLANSTKKRLVSDVPSGVLLSGGVDSSSIAAFAQQFSSEPIKTFSIGFNEASFNESDFAREVSEHLGTEHHEMRLSANRAARLIPEIATWLDEPISDSSILPTFLLSRFVKNNRVTVALGGEGGDELFGGYPTYYAHKLAHRYEKIPRILRRNLIENLINRLPVSDKNMSFEFLAKRFITAVEHQDLVTRHYSLLGSFEMKQQETLLTDYVKSRNGNDVYAESRRHIEGCDSNNVVEKMQYLDIGFYLAENILTKTDRASMAVSLEVRSPFLDHKIAEFAASLPKDYNLKCDTIKFVFGKTGKYILKKAVAPLLPPSVLKRPKQGFVIPAHSWIKGELKPLVYDLLSPDRLKIQGLFDPKYVQKMLVEHETGKQNHYKTIWNLLVFQLWFDNFGTKSL